MGKKVKTGKSRKDKFYHLAKETGYRARSAFKLIQLNRKFNFLQESRVLIDLCAAPGGWLQVASNFMPMSSIIIGVDLVTIKPINKVTTIQSDITTDHCRQSLKKELKSWSADVVLNDGAPNVGQAWVQDAFSQAQLALSALKLASEHLRKGGWFITKVFRSKDYTALLWVFNQLFKKVHATKPQASRNESAEIFVVCEGYLKPDKLDDKFLDPKHVFKEIQEDSKVRLNILRPEKVTRQREGYAENNVSLHTTITAADFVNSQNAIDILSTTNKITIKDASILNHKATTAEVKICCEDIKVLGRKEIKLLFSWRKKLRKDLKLDAGPDEEVIEEITKTEEEKEEEKEEELDQTIADLKKEELKDLKKKKKRVREQKKKLRERLASKLNDANGDICADEQDLFALSQIQNKKHLESVEDAKEVNFESESELEFEDSEDSEDEEYTYGDDELYEKPAAKKSKASQELLEKKTKKKEKRRNVENPLLVDEDEIESGVKKSEEEVQLERAQQWFQKDIFKDVDDSDDDVYDIEQFATKVPKKKSKNVEAAEEMDLEEAVEEAEVEDSDSDSGVDSEIDDRSISQGKKDVKSAEKAAHEENQRNKKVSFEVAPQQKATGGTLGPEALALGTAMVTSRKRKRDIIEEGFNRYSFNDNGLPSWFIEDEVKHTTRHLPVTREEVDFYKQRMREINARPIKKVIEAKAKKKSQMLKKLDRARRKAEGILDADTTSQEKQSQIKSIYKKAGLLKKKKEEVKYVVAKKSQAGKKIPRPAGVKGRYKIVDPRMKKDLKAAKAKEKTHGRKKRK